MRTLPVLALLCSCPGAGAQVNYTSVYDTEKVYVLEAADDTTIHLNEEYRYGEWMIYFDAAKKRKAAHFNFADSTDWDTTWYINGQLHSIYRPAGQYCYLCSSLQSWYIDGKWRDNKICTADSCVEYTYYSNGQLKSVDKSVKTPKSGKFMTSYYSMDYHSNGQPQRDFIDSSGRRQRLRAYYYNGQVSTETTWQRGGHVGPYTSYYENGQPWIVGQYKIPPDDGKHHSTVSEGKWSYYHRDGQLQQEEFYDDRGRLVKRLEYKDGKLVKEILYDGFNPAITIEH
jgi:antitoxin component YwqK of YwqJK toxin-antitoxin module